jgi:hypothetical protein
MNALLQLAERCEAAEGADRELDWAIFDLVATNPQRCGYMELGLQAVPAYTASLDAAMTLVPEGWNGRLEWCRGAGYADLAHVKAGRGFEDCRPAKTAALALCAAALRARALQSKDTHDE